MRGQARPAALVPHLSELLEVVMTALDPAHTTLRRTCLQVCVTPTPHRLKAFMMVVQ